MFRPIRSFLRLRALPLNVVVVPVGEVSPPRFWESAPHRIIGAAATALGATSAAEVDLTKVDATALDHAMTVLPTLCDEARRDVVRQATLAHSIRARGSAARRQRVRIAERVRQVANEQRRRQGLPVLPRGVPRAELRAAIQASPAAQRLILRWMRASATIID